MRKANRRFNRCLRQLERCAPNHTRARRLSRLAVRAADKYFEIYRNQKARAVRDAHSVERAMNAFPALVDVAKEVLESLAGNEDLRAHARAALAQAEVNK